MQLRVWQNSAHALGNVCFLKRSCDVVVALWQWWEWWHHWMLYHFVVVATDVFIGWLVLTWWWGWRESRRKRGERGVARLHVCVCVCVRARARAHACVSACVLLIFPGLSWGSSTTPSSWSCLDPQMTVQLIMRVQLTSLLLILPGLSRSTDTPHTTMR